MPPLISASRVGDLVAGFSREPAYAGLAEALRVAIGDGRIPPGTQLPSERELTATLHVSRTTVTRAYADLREQGYAIARRGSGTFTQIPGGRANILDRVLSPQSWTEGAIDLNCAASSALPSLTAAYRDALGDLSAYLSGPGYYPSGLPVLQQALAESFCDRGLATTADQIVVTPGALAGTAMAAAAVFDRGDRVVVESPTYPNAVRAFIRAGARPMTIAVDRVDAWDLASLESSLATMRPRAAYLVVDHHNPTGHLMADADRARLARALAAAGTIAIVDETHQQLTLDAAALTPRPMAAHVADAGGEAITVGGLGKSVWGGLRVGWLRGSPRLVQRITQTRLSMDLGVPVLEQLVALRLHGDVVLLDEHRARLRAQRDALATELASACPSWRFAVPSGGLALWCELPRPEAPELADRAERLGVMVTPGPVFAPLGGLGRYVRVPWTRPATELRQAARVLGQAWDSLAAKPKARNRPAPTLVA